MHNLYSEISGNTINIVSIPSKNQDPKIQKNEMNGDMEDGYQEVGDKVSKDAPVKLQNVLSGGQEYTERIDHELSCLHISEP